MTGRKTAAPFHDDDWVYFELRSPGFRAFDGASEGGSYSVRRFRPGVYRLPIDAIGPATAQDKKKRPEAIIAVDSCQIFFVDSAFVAKFRECLDGKEGSWPNYRYFQRLRTRVGVDFGLASVTSDGSYVLDLSRLKAVRQSRKETGNADDPYEKVARRMRTFICERCFDEEFMENGESAWELAQLARSQGWLIATPKARRDRWFFEEFEVVGPKCAARRGRSG